MRGIDGKRAAVLVSLLGANLYWSASLFYPIQLLVTLLHEMSHALAALATGGRVLRINVDPDLGGACLIQGGWPLIHIPAGYIGSSLIGAGILLAASRSRLHRPIAAALGALLLAMTVRYVRTPLGFGAGLVYGGFLVASGWMLRDWANELLLSFIGVATLSYAFYDVKLLLSRPELRQRSDAYLFSAHVFPLPPLVWAALWCAISTFIFFWTLRASVRRGKF